MTVQPQINNSGDTRLARMVMKLQGTELRHDLEGLAIDAMGELGLGFGDNPYLRDGGSWQHNFMFYQKHFLRSMLRRVTQLYVV